MSGTQTTSEVGPIRIAKSGSAADGGRAFLRAAARFVGCGLVLYAGLYAVSEWLVSRYAERNRFHVVQSATTEPYDFVVLGASHAAVFDYRDMNSRLEAMTGARILNLANVGAGVTVNRFLLDYFLREHETDAVVYVLDSFAFYSDEWNEERMRDSNLYLRAGFDPSLVGMLLSHPATRSTALAYASGFPKINNRDRFEPDLFEAEGATFDRTYRPIAQLDRQRIQYLYPDVGPNSLQESPYLGEFEALIADVLDRGDRFIIVRPPVPQRFYGMIPHEPAFDRTIQELARRTGAELYDFSAVANDPEFFYDSDHLNRTGVLNFFERHLATVLAPTDGAPDGS